MQSETRIDGPHGAVGIVTPRWFLGYPRWCVVTPDPQPTISGARTDSEPVAKGNHAQIDFATPPDDPDMREEEVWDFEAARGATPPGVPRPNVVVWYNRPEEGGTLWQTPPELAPLGLC